MNIKEYSTKWLVPLGLFVVCFALVIFFPELVEETIMALTEGTLTCFSLLLAIVFHPITWLIIAVYYLVGHKCR